MSFAVVFNYFMYSTISLRLVKQVTTRIGTYWHDDIMILFLIIVFLLAMAPNEYLPLKLKKLALPSANIFLLMCRMTKIAGFLKLIGPYYNFANLVRYC